MPRGGLGILDFLIPLRGSSRLQFLFGASPTTFQTTTDNVAGLSTLLIESGIIDPQTGMKVMGLPIGWCGEERSGGAMPFDPFEIQRILEGMFNMLIVGEGGMWKSSFVKWFLYLASKAGYKSIVTDMKGEYNLEGLIDDVRVFKFGKDAELYINVFDPIFDPATCKRLLEMMALITMSRSRGELTEYEERVLWSGAVAVRRRAREENRVPILPELVTLLFGEPTQEMVQTLHMDPEQIKEIAHRLALGLQRLTIEADSDEIEIAGQSLRVEAEEDDLLKGLDDEFSDLRGIFHKHTTPGLLDPASVLVFDCSDLKGDMELLAVDVINIFTQELAAQTGNRYHFIFLDENWKLVQHPKHVESLVASEKLGGTLGTAVCVVFHAISDAFLSGNAAAVEAIIGASQIKLIFRQTEANLAASKGYLQLTDEEAAVIPKLEPGWFMLKIGNRRGILVQSDPTEKVKEFLQTRGLSHGKATPFAM